MLRILKKLYIEASKDYNTIYIYIHICIPMDTIVFIRIGPTEFLERYKLSSADKTKPVYIASFSPVISQLRY